MQQQRHQQQPGFTSHKLASSFGPTSELLQRIPRFVKVQRFAPMLLAQHATPLDAFEQILQPGSDQIRLKMTSAGGVFPWWACGCRQPGSRQAGHGWREAPAPQFGGGC